MALRNLYRHDLFNIAKGGCFFGSGGGGTLQSAENLIKKFEKGDYYPTDHVPVVDVDDVKDGDAVVVAYLGAPAMINSAEYPYGPEMAVSRIKTKLAAVGRTLSYIAPPESGALGFSVACLVAARLGLKVIDGDGAGRAVPSLPQLIYASAQVSPRPAVLVNQAKSLYVELDVTTCDEGKNRSGQIEDVSQIIDDLMRPIVSEPEFAQFGGLAIWVMNPPLLREAMSIRGTLSHARHLGEMVDHIETGTEMIKVLSGNFGLTARLLFGPGEIMSCEQDTTSGFDVGKIFISDGRQTCTVLYQNESLLVWTDDKRKPLCMAPDSIALFVGGEGQRVFSNGDLLNADGKLRPDMKGRKAWLIGIAAHPALRDPEGTITPTFHRMVARMGYGGKPFSLKKDLENQKGGAK